MVADRISTPVQILPATGDGTTRILVARAAQDEGASDLYLVSVDAAGTPPAERMLAANVVANPYGGCTFGTRPCLQADARGRLLVFSGFDPATGGSSMARIDPLTGDRTELGVITNLTLSPSGQRLVVERRGEDANATLYESDDRAVPLDVVDGAFADEVFYYLTSQHEAMRLAPGGAPERLATGVTLVRPFTVDGGVVLELMRPTADPAVDTDAFLDTATLRETPSPLASHTFFAISPDGHWLLSTDYATGAITFTDWQTGAQDVLQPTRAPINYGYQWRPGHDELWLPDATEQPTTWIKTPGLPAVEVPGLGFGFTPDGAYWFSSRSPDYNQGLLVGSADDPTGPQFELNPPGTQPGSSWQTPDGRIVTAAWTSTPELSNVYVVDPNTGDRQVMGEQGAVVSVGQMRLLVTQHMVGHEGDLTVFDLGTGQPTVLAWEFALLAVVETQGADQVAPGAAVAFKFQARFPSPYDGIWLTTVP